MAAIFTDDIFKSIFNENDTIPIPISLEFVPGSPINYKTVLVQVMNRRRTCGKPLLEPTMTHICDSRTRWLNVLLPINAHTMFLCVGVHDKIRMYCVVMWYYNAQFNDIIHYRNKRCHFTPKRIDTGVSNCQKNDPKWVTKYDNFHKHYTKRITIYPKVILNKSIGSWIPNRMVRLRWKKGSNGGTIRRDHVDVPGDR